ncbi:MAG TPA: hypothetical protein VE442_01480 [Jatrophihabitans sp.]|jgi:hypothetical protein|nr:hypothetical protein [Jatrophihabitans sp.]
MLFIAEGQIDRPIEAGDRTVAAAWLGPMVDSGFLQAGYLDAAGKRVVMILSAPDRAEIDQRLGDLPIVRDQKVAFTVSQVTALRFS